MFIVIVFIITFCYKVNNQEKKNSKVGDFQIFNWLSRKVYYLYINGYGCGLI